MKYRLAVLAAAVIAAFTLASVATAAPVSKAVQFHALKKGPGFKVTCGIEIHAPNKPATEVLCGAQGIPAPKTKGVGDPGFVQIGVLGTPQVLRLSQDSFVAGPTATLGRGRLWNQLGVTCHVAEFTIMCFNGVNHGFVIGNGHYRTF